MPNKDPLKYNQYMKEYMLQRYHQRRIEGFTLLGNKCVNCGETKDLEFDHLDPKEKSFTIAKMSSIRYELFITEIKKCQLLCKKCHKYKHAVGKRTHGTLASHRYCKCELCREAHNQYCRKWKKKKRLSNL